MSGRTSDYRNVKISGDINADGQLFDGIFKNDAILRRRRIRSRSGGFECLLLYMDGMVNNEIINDSVVRPLMTVEAQVPDGDRAQFVREKILFSNDVGTAATVDEMLRAILYGDTLLIVDKSKTALTLNTKGWRTRGISEPSDERVLQGPREGFDEAAMFNVAMIRRKLLTPDFCVEVARMGQRTETLVFICYLGTLVDRRALGELKKRMSRIDMDGVLDVNYIAEQVRDNRGSLFKTTGTTERPDTVAARLLEGRIAVVVDGTPVVLTLPYLFSENFQSDEDYYLNHTVSSVGRALRYICFFAAVSVPAIFVALVSFHPQLLPTSFAISTAQLRGGVPLPTVAECLILILVFEILKETGVRTPQSLGHALSIVGGLVVGQAAVEARIISAPMLITVALSGISGLMVPRLKGAVFYIRIAFVLAAAMAGLYGYLAALGIVICYIFSLRSFGVDCTVSVRRFTRQSFKDIFWRAPWNNMYRRPAFNKNAFRMSGGRRK